ncbi:LTA synthase family protein [Oenococcus oeni]|nr:LTA synthase family protein [Oenococcus oeni]EJO06241.1 hypothetical protein AWRIB422_914 [Oenococcus oeni AWRIB422]
MNSGLSISRWIFYPFALFLSAILDICFIQFEIQINTSQTLVQKVQTVSNFLINAFIPGSQNHQAILNIIFVIALFAFLLAITNRFWLALIINNVVFIIFGIADNLKIVYRDESILPSDLSQLSSPTELVSFIGMTPVQLFLILLAIIFIIIFIYFAFRYFDSRIKFTKWYIRIILLIFSILIFISAGNLYTPGTVPYKIATKLSDNPVPWDVNEDQRNNGAVYSFMRFFDNKVMTTPKGYSRAAIEKLDEKYTKIADKINKTRKSYINKQTVIYVLSESFSDPTRVPGSHVTPDPMPNIRKIKNETTSGLMLSSGYGGGTANLEYQALTGMSLTNFLPTLTSPYVQLAASAKYLPNVSNYWSIKNAIHPYFPVIYDRSAVYKNMGFQKFYTLYSPKIKYTKRIGNSPYISDLSAYKNVLWVLKKHKKSQFIQMPTMQNHMSYNNWYKKYTFKISSTYNRSSWESGVVKTYVQGVSYTDNSTKWFIKKINKIKKPITIVWYGDHLPGIYDSEISNPNNMLSLHETELFSSIIS